MLVCPVCRTSPSRSGPYRWSSGTPNARCRCGRFGVSETSPASNHGWSAWFSNRPGHVAERTSIFLTGPGLDPCLVSTEDGPAHRGLSPDDESTYRYLADSAVAFLILES